MCRLLTAVSFDILTPDEQKEAVETAYEFGEQFANEWPVTEEDPAEPTRREYVRTVVRWCHRMRYHTEDLELELWYQAPGLEDDPRVLFWRAGVEERRKELGG